MTLLPSNQGIVDEQDDNEQEELRIAERMSINYSKSQLLANRAPSRRAARCQEYAE